MDFVTGLFVLQLPSLLTSNPGSLFFTLVTKGIFPSLQYADVYERYDSCTNTNHHPLIKEQRLRSNHLSCCVLLHTIRQGLLRTTC